MAEIMGNWPSGHGQITKIWPSDRCGGKTIPAAMQFGYNLREFGGYLGNVGLMVARLGGDVIIEPTGSAIGSLSTAFSAAFVGKREWSSGEIPVNIRDVDNAVTAQRS